MAKEKKQIPRDEKALKTAPAPLENHIAVSVEEDPFLDKMVLIFLVVFLLAVIFIPQEWFLKWSMWWNGIK